MDFTAGDRVHLPGVGTGTVRESRSGGRVVVVIKGRSVVAAAADLQAVNPPREAEKKAKRSSGVSASASADSALRRDTPGDASVTSLDLHGKTVGEALAAVEIFLNDALLAGAREVRMIHGRSGGRVKSAVYQYLRGVSAVTAFRLHPRNPGVTIVSFE